MDKQGSQLNKSRLFGTRNNLVRVRTHRYGMLRLRILTVGDAVFIEEALKQNITAREFVRNLVHHQLVAPEIPLKEIEGWKDKLLIRVATLWITHKDTIGRNYQSEKEPFDAIRSTIKFYLTEHNEKMLKILSSIIEPPRLNFVIPELKLIDSAFTAQLSTYAKQNQNTISSLIRSLDTFGSAKDHLASISNTWLHDINPAKDIAAAISDVLPNIQSQLDEIAAITKLADTTIVAIDWSHFYDRLAIPLETSQTFKSVFLNFSESYKSLIDSFRVNQFSILNYPPDFTRLPTIEYFTSADLLESIVNEDTIPIEAENKQQLREELASETEDSLRAQLLSLNADLIRLWEGAISALKSDNPDRARHFATSLRELLTHVMHQLSPDGEIKKWNPDPQLYDKNRPTRRARLLFICRNINHGPFSDFVEKDVEAVLAFVQLFQQGTHAIAIPYTENQLLALKAKMEGVIRFLISIALNPTDGILQDTQSPSTGLESGITALRGKSEQVFIRLHGGVLIIAPLPSSVYIEKIESIQNILLARATGHEQLEDEYKRLREELIQDECIKPLLPKFVVTNRNLAQFWAYIKTKFSTYKERREYIWSEFSLLLDGLEKGNLSYESEEDMEIKPLRSITEKPTSQRLESIENITILFLAADPTDQSRLRLGEELREIQEKLQLAKLRDKFTLHQRMSVRPTDISQALLDIQPQIVHFSGHGAMDNGGLCIEDKMGKSQLVDVEALASLFEQFTDHISCVVLNACYSEQQAKAIAKHVPYVIGMNNVIDDKASIAFTIGFYQAFGAGRKIENAFKFGCMQIRLQGLSDYVTPILIPRDSEHP